MEIKQFIRRCESLDLEVERRYLEAFLFSMTGLVRVLWVDHGDTDTRLQILRHISELNRYVLKRVMAIADGTVDPFRSTEYMWNCVQEFATPVPALDEWVPKLADRLLTKYGA